MNFTSFSLTLSIFPIYFLCLYNFSLILMQQWTSQEDESLLKLYKQIQVYNRWKQISKKMFDLGFQKNELECRNRYHNKLNPDLNLDKWSTKQVEKIFRFYDQYGSKWNLIEAFIPGRTQNNIKNRFFSTLKNLLRKLLKYFPDASTEKSMKYISSRDITQLYQARGRFKKFKGLMKKILKQINFEIQIKSLDSVVEIYKEILQQLAQVFTQNQQKSQVDSTPKKENMVSCEEKKQKLENHQKNEKVQSDVTEGNENTQMMNYQPIFGGWTIPVVNQQQENIVFIQNSVPTNTFVQNNWGNYSMWNQYIQAMLSCPISPYTAESS